MKTIEDKATKLLIEYIPSTQWKQEKILGRWLLFSSFGNVIDLETGRHLRLEDIAGYWHFICDWPAVNRKIKLHRQMAKLFIGHPPAPGYQAHHINHCKKDNRVDNLMWVTPAENIGYYREFKKENPGLDKLMRQEAKKRKEVVRLKNELRDIDCRIMLESRHKTYFEYPQAKFSSDKKLKLEMEALELLKIGVKVIDDAMCRIKQP